MTQESRPIECLPNELLCHIFEAYVIDNKCPPVPLLLVCSRWKAVALQTSSFWACISIINKGPLFLANRTLCSNSEKLAKAIERTRSGLFQLRFEAEDWKEDVDKTFIRVAHVDSTWLSRCKSLFLIRTPNDNCLHGFSQAHWKSLTTLFIHISPGINVTTMAFFGSLFQRLEEDSLQLQRIACLSSPIAVDLVSRPRILRRLKFARLSFWDNLPNDAQWSELCKLEELIIRTSPGLSIPYTAKLPSLKRCSLLKTCYTFLPISVLGQLAALTIQDQQMDPPIVIVDLPALKELILDEVDWTMARFFNAPALLKLELRYDCNTGKNQDKAFSSIWLDCHTSAPLKPRVLYLDISYYQDLTLTGLVFRKYMQSLEVLHLVFSDLWNVPLRSDGSPDRKPPSLEPLYDALIPSQTSTISDRSFCPALTALSFILSSKDNWPKGELEDWVDKVKEGRQKAELSIDVDITYE